MWLMAISALSAYFVKGLCGFANTLVFSTIAGFGSSNIDISPMELLLGYPSNVIMAVRERRGIDWKVCAPLIALVLLGNIPGILLLKNVDARAIKAVFGAVIMLIAAEMLFRQLMPRKMKSNRIVLGAIGLISGLLCGLYGIGALLAAYVSRVTEDGSAFRGNLCAVFTVENTFRIVMYSALGIITWDTLMRAAMLVPAMGLGLFLGIKCCGVLSEKVVKYVVIAMLIVSGASMLITNL
ncbi:MAG: sulfite exporter TauE/SafE family protein [Candidatus Fimadaptatus sp.]|jgi:uncharacterized membrane protein YfcA